MLDRKNNNFLMYNYYQALFVENSRCNWMLIAGMPTNRKMIF